MKKIQNKKKIYKSLLIPIFIGGFCGFLLSKIFMISIVDGHSMDNTLHHKGILFVNKLYTKIDSPKPGDIVILKTDKTDKRNLLVKRLIGISGDFIEINDNKVYRNGKLLSEPYIKETMINNKNLNLKIPKDKIFFMGDNRNSSYDSREEGLYPVDSIVRKVFYFH